MPRPCCGFGLFHLQTQPCFIAFGRTLLGGVTLSFGMKMTEAKEGLGDSSYFGCTETNIKKKRAKTEVRDEEVGR